MKIHLHKNARTTPAQRQYIQENAAVSTASIAARLGISETTVRRWKNRASVMDRSHAPRTLRTTMTPAQELTAVLIRLTLRCGLDDLLAIMRAFVFSGCSRSGLNRCLKRYGIARLAPMPRRLATDLKDYRGAHFYHTQVHLPGMPLTRQSLVMDIILDCSFRCINARVSSQTDRSSLPFVQRVISEFPFKALGLIYEPPIFLGERGLPDVSCRNQQMLEHFCHLKNIRYCPAGLISMDTRQRLARAWAAMASPPFPALIEPGQIQDKICKALVDYHAMPLRSLRQATPTQALLAHHKEFPSSFSKKPTNLLGPEISMPAAGPSRHHFCLHGG